MNYREFLLVLLVPLLVVAMGALAVGYRPAAASARRRVRRGGVLVVALAFAAVLYTAPWDSWLIVHSVWWYPPGSVLGTVGLVPIEEYLFMIGQTLVTGCWTLGVLTRSAGAGAGRAGPWRRPVCAAGWLVTAALGVGLYRQPHTLYLGAILAWFGPLLAVHSATGADVLRVVRRDRLIALAATPPLWIADAVAIHAGAWQIGAAHTTGLRPLGVPIEEALFFLITNLLIVDSVLLIDAPVVRRRVARWFSPRRHDPATSHEERPCARSPVGPTTS